MEYKEYFKSKVKHEAYPFQIAVAEALLKGKNVILRAPTGSGKTFASTLPYFYAKLIGNSIADKIIYSIPLRSLGHSIASEIEKIGAKPVYHDGNCNIDPYFESEIIVTTIDQTLSAYLGYPFNVENHRNRNITRGAFVGSLLIFDEFHLYELDRLGRTTIDLIHRLENTCQWIIMTATMSDIALKNLAKLPNTEFIELSDKEQTLVNQGRQKHISCSSNPMDASEIIGKNGKSIVICNTVARSQSIYNDLIQKKKELGLDHQIILFHSRFLEGDRKKKEEEIQTFFGKYSASNINAILVATQVIEAGLDISCTYLHTDLAPANSIIQRIGRCARFKDEEGWIIIYEVLDDKNNRYILPYNVEKDIIDATWKLFQSLHILTVFQTELNALNKIYVDTDAKNYESLWKDMPIRELYTELFTHENTKQSKYIRSIISTNFAVMNECDDKEFPRQTISMAPYIVAGALKKIEGISQYGWIRELKKSKSDDDWIYEYKYIALTKETLNKLQKEYPHYIILFPSVASYDSEYGFSIGKTSGNETPIAEKTEKPFEPYRYDCETFQFHAESVANYMSSRAKNSVALRCLCRKYSVNENDMLSYLDYSGKFHDIGKLNIPCQKHFHIQQMENDPKNKNYDSNQYYAHSTFDSRIHKKASNTVSHSYESAYISMHAFLNLGIPKYIIALMCFAIAKHHSSKNTANTDRIGDIFIDAKKVGDLYEAMHCKIAIKSKYQKGDVQDTISNFLTDRIVNVQSDYFPILIYFQRMLRLGDWHSLDYMKTT